MKPQAILRYGGLLGCLFQSLSLFGQSTTSSADNVMVLSPFVVNTQSDDGYRSTDSITATGINLQLVNIPQNVQIVNNALFKDALLIDANESAKFIAGAQFTGDSNFANSITLHGFSIPIERNGTTFRLRNPGVDSVDRAEYLKGAAAIFNGNITPGGVVNYITYRPQFSRTQGEVQITAGSYDYLKTSLRVTGPLLKDKVAYFVGLSTEDASDWVEYSGKNADSLYAALTVNPFKKLTININHEYENTYQQAHPWVTTSTPLLQYSNAAPTVEIATFLAAYPPGTLQSTEVVNKIMYPKGWRSNVNGPQAHQDTIWNTTEVDTSLTINRSITIRNKESFNSGADYALTLNPFRATNGYQLGLSSISSETLQRYRDFNSTTEAAFDIDRFGVRHQMLVGYSLELLKRGSSSRSGTSAIFPYNPRTSGPRNLMDEILARNPGTTLNPSPALNTIFKTQGAYVLDHMTLWKQKVHISLGARYTIADQGGAGVIDPINRAKRTTPQAGVVYKFTDNLALYASYSESFQPSNLVDYLNKQVPPMLGTGSDIGLKWETKTFSATLSAFTVIQDAIASRDFDAEAKIRAQGVTNESALRVYILGGQQRAQGAEFEARYAPNKNLEMLFAYSNLWQANVTKAAPDSNGYTFNLGMRLPDAPKQSMYFLTKYSFTDGPLKNLSCSAGVQFASERKIHPSPLTGASQPGYGTLDFGAKYLATVLGKKLEFQLNVKNATDERYLAGYFVLASVRKVYLTTRYKF